MGVAETVTAAVQSVFGSRNEREIRRLLPTVQHILDLGPSFRKLSDADVGNLKRDRLSGMTYAELSEKYGVVKSTISYILNSKTYKNHMGS